MKGQSRGITLIALVITIILLLILAGIAISQLTGENGLFSRAKEAKKQAEIADYKEALEMIGYDLNIEKVSNGLSYEEYIQRYKEEIGEDSRLKGKVQITDNADGSINVTTKEGYVFKVTENGVEYINDDGENNTDDEEESTDISVYAKLYTDGTLIFSSTSYKDPTRTVAENYRDVSELTKKPGWIENNKSKATNIIIYDNIAPKSTYYWFCGYEGNQIDFSKIDTTDVTNMEGMFCGFKSDTLDLTSLVTDNVTNMQDMFSGADIFNLDVSSWNTSNVIHMGYMFMDYKSPNLDISNFDTSNVTEMWMMFCRSKITNLDISNFNTSKVEYIYNLFEGCKDLKTLEVSVLDFTNVVNGDIGELFCGCENLLTLDVSGFITSNVKVMTGMFSGCKSLKTINVSSLDVSSVTRMDRMFEECSSLESLDLSMWDVSSVVDVSTMFLNCKSLKTLDISNFNLPDINYAGIFQGTSENASIRVNVATKEWMRYAWPEFTNVIL